MADENLLNSLGLGDVVPPPSTTISTKPEYCTCRFCHEEIQPDAAKCKHCGEFLHESLRTNQQTMPTFNPGIAAVLSFIVPGLGQMYRGKIATGFLWLIATVIGYVFFIVPGLLLHVTCVVMAARK